LHCNVWLQQFNQVWNQVARSKVLDERQRISLRLRADGLLKGVHFRNFGDWTFHNREERQTADAERQQHSQGLWAPHPLTHLTLLLGTNFIVRR
jgi:hypothetical protein